MTLLRRNPVSTSRRALEPAPPPPPPRWRRPLIRVAAAAGALTVLLLAGWAIASVLRSPGRPVRRAATDPVPVRLSVDANLPVRVFAKHPPEERAREAATELGETPLHGVAGAHVRDTILLANPIQDAFYEETIAFGEPDQAVRIVKEFKTGHVRFRLPPGGGRSLFVYLNDLQVAPYSAQVKIELTEGKHTLEIRGDALSQPVEVEVLVKRGEVTEIDPPARLRTAE